MDGGSSEIPNVVSVSYGEDEYSVGLAYASRCASALQPLLSHPSSCLLFGLFVVSFFTSRAVCRINAEFIKLGARGLTIMFASGPSFVCVGTCT